MTSTTLAATPRMRFSIPDRLGRTVTDGRMAAESPGRRPPTTLGRMYAVSFYTVAAGQSDRIQEVYPRHRAYLDEFARTGQIAMIGTFADPLADGSMAIFRSHDAAETFRAADPFVLEGVVGDSRILDWDPLEFPATC